MNTEDLLEQAREIWPESMTGQEIAVAMGVIYGDICRIARDKTEGKDVDESELKKELGNIIFSTLRWCDDLGFKPKECLEIAIKANQKYAANLKTAPN